MKLLRFAAKDQDIFLAIKSGKKKVETRAATERYQNIKTGDTLSLVCGKEKYTKRVVKVSHFKSIGATLKKYKPAQINPNLKTADEIRDMYNSFSGYTEKIKKFGLIAMELE